jgi:hypothetical protein
MPRTRPKRQDECEWMTVEDLPYDARIRHDHAGEWVAWNSGLTNAVATGLDYESVRAAAIATGTERPVLECGGKGVRNR